jgi:hypothetical protein
MKTDPETHGTQREREILFFRLLFLHRAKARVSLESHPEEKREREILIWRLLFFHSAKGRVSLEQHTEENRDRERFSFGDSVIPSSFKG